jgi:hypothetical protein
MTRSKVAALTDPAKTRILARAIATVAIARGAASLRDGVQAGLTEGEVSRLWDAALVEARRIEPRLPDMAVQP